MQNTGDNLCAVFGTGTATAGTFCPVLGPTQRLGVNGDQRSGEHRQ